MQTYYLITILQFFQSQKNLGFEAIELIVDILQDEMLNDEDKRDGIIYMLHKYGLNETSYKEGLFAPTFKQCELPGEEKKEFDFTVYNDCFMTQLFNFKLLNGNILIEVALN